MNTCCNGQPIVVEEYNEDELKGCGPHVTQAHPILEGLDIKRGEVLYLNSGELSQDETGDAYAIAPFDIDTTAEADAIEMSVFVSGEFNEEVVELNGGTLATVKDQLRQKGIFLKKHC